MTIREHTNILAQGNRKMMRFCALRYRANRRSGNVAFMVTWLSHAVLYRRLAANLLEAA